MYSSLHGNVWFSSDSQSVLWYASSDDRGDKATLDALTVPELHSSIRSEVDEYLSEYYADAAHQDLMVSRSRDNRSIIWHTRVGATVNRQAMRVPGGVYDVFLAPSGQLIIHSANDRLLIWQNNSFRSPISKRLRTIDFIEPFTVAAIAGQNRVLLYDLRTDRFDEYKVAMSDSKDQIWRTRVSKQCIVTYTIGAELTVTSRESGTSTFLCKRKLHDFAMQPDDHTVHAIEHVADNAFEYVSIDIRTASFVRNRPLTRLSCISRTAQYIADLGTSAVIKIK